MAIINSMIRSLWNDNKDFKITSSSLIKNNRRCPLSLQSILERWVPKKNQWNAQCNSTDLRTKDRAKKITRNLWKLIMKEVRNKISDLKEPLKFTRDSSSKDSNNKIDTNGNTNEATKRLRWTKARF